MSQRDTNLGHLHPFVRQFDRAAKWYGDAGAVLREANG
jgi:hypothetical protein